MILLLFILLHTATSDFNRLEAEKDKACSSGIDAASDSLRGDGTVNLFVGRRIFVFNPHNRSLVDVLDLSTNFEDLDGPVEAAAASRRGYSSNDFYLITRVGRVYAYINSNNGASPLIADQNGRTWREFDPKSKLPLRGDTPNPDCMAAMCEGDSTCYYWRVFNNWEHRKLFCERRHKTSERAPDCHYDDDYIVAPKTMDIDLIRGIETPCEAMAVTYDQNTHDTALLYVDKTNMHYFVNHAHEFTIPVNDVFGCSSFLSNPIVWVVLGVSVVLILVVAPGIVVVIAKSRKHELDEMTVESRTRTVAKARTP